ncbi:MAG: hypothetical protein L0Y72_32175 [Gemmataceae bacterium]|nr:hypothetical protein [Gemmataceae bacterium]MCI0743713.1 hypothetical protein [Gemmataceae bacterium]
MQGRILFAVLLLVVVGGLCCAPRDDKPPVVIGPNGNDKKAPDLPGPLQARIEAALKHVAERDLRTDNGFWTIFHGILGNGLETTLLDPATGTRVNAIDHMRAGNTVRGMTFIPSRDGLDVVTFGPSKGFDGPVGEQFVSQGHQDQFVAEMMQWGLPADTKFTVKGKEHTFEDFIRFSRARVRTDAKQELSWALIVVGQHYGVDHTFTNSEGDRIHFEDMVRYELEQPIVGAACGGTHRLFGLTWVYHLHRNKGGAKDGVWKGVADRIEEYKANAKRNRNKGDGSFSTAYFEGPGNASNTQLRIGTTGHILEWLALAMTDEELKSAWMQETAGALAVMILNQREEAVDGGSLYHAAHGLRIYHSRVFGPPIPVIPLPPKD